LRNLSNEYLQNAVNQVDCSLKQYNSISFIDKLNNEISQNNE
jgi:hypothetical protein